MQRPWVLAILTILVAGCATRKPMAPDAFFGRTAVPPPATGMAQAPRDSYLATSEKVPATPANNAGHTSGAVIAALPSPTATTSLPPNSSPAEPVNHRSVSTVAKWETGPIASGAIQTRIRPPDYGSPADESAAAANRTTTVAQSPAPNATLSAQPSALASASPGEPIVNIIQPRATAADQHIVESQAATPTVAKTDNSVMLAGTSGTSSWTTCSAQVPPASGPVGSAGDARPPATAVQQPPQQTVMPGRVINIMDLPDPPGRPTRPPRADPRVRQASAVVPAGAATSGTAPWSTRVTQASFQGIPPSGRPATQSPTGTPPSLRYSYSPDYACLRGRLEYSEVAKRWKLRYIPIDGRVDPYGGSVVLGESTLLASVQQGDFVEVRGRLLTGENGHWGYAPVYQIAQLRPIGQ